MIRSAQQAAWMAVALVPAAASASEPAQPAPVEASLHVVPADAASDPWQVGTVLQLRDGWHVYWKHPGATGLATEVELRVEGASARVEPAGYPVPERFVQPGDIDGYGYADRVVFVADVTLEDPPPSGEEAPSVHAEVSWLACKEICIPGEARVSTPLTPQGAATTESVSLDEWRDRVPAKTPENVSVRVRGSLDDGYRLDVRWGDPPPSHVEWFPVLPDALELARREVETSGRRTRIRVRLRRLAGQTIDSGARLESVLAYTANGGRRRGITIEVPVEP